MRKKLKKTGKNRFFGLTSMSVYVKLENARKFSGGVLHESKDHYGVYRV